MRRVRSAAEDVELDAPGLKVVFRRPDGGLTVRCYSFYTEAFGFVLADVNEWGFSRL